MGETLLKKPFIFNDLFFLEKSFDKMQGAPYNHAHCPAQRQQQRRSAGRQEKEEKTKIVFFLLTSETSFGRFLALTDSPTVRKTSVFTTGNFCGENRKVLQRRRPQGY
ncbi:MAG TPA: hypothetical protein PLX33_07250 [Alphaproteobacteria bacterium]|nr:hypothetical protein [Alphaproteobacteria bacterium]